MTVVVPEPELAVLVEPFAEALLRSNWLYRRLIRFTWLAKQDVKKITANQTMIDTIARKMESVLRMKIKLLLSEQKLRTNENRHRVNDE